ncbi:MAG TPA: phosphoribosylaminoimidazolesuccinocarboxamide synthase [Bacteroidales bacterium]|nr:phosphoribosylaminoimidazolesuccinocarboxamide synthase [Bacteroidales bacterium]HNR43419.1 phosphoribosylaminoimidazolesuccinocarboxamide synthase [Bacteroidales bacterium]
MTQTITDSDFKFLGQTGKYRGKVRDVYNICDKYLLMVVSDRISAFDVVLPRGIPYKGQVLNQIAGKFLDATADIVPNWKIATPDPAVTFGHKCRPYPVEMIVRAHLTGSSWRLYKAGTREICGIRLPDGMREHQRFPVPIVTPTTKAEQGTHDEDILPSEIIRRGLISGEEYQLIENYAQQVFIRGAEIAADHGLILVDAKYEFGNLDGQVMLIDEVHTPDSARYFYADEYQDRFERGLPQKQLSKEFVREWLMERGFRGEKGQKIPRMTDDFVKQVSERYIELYERITGEKFEPSDITDVRARIEGNCTGFLKSFGL